MVLVHTRERPRARYLVDEDHRVTEPAAVAGGLGGLQAHRLELAQDETVSGVSGSAARRAESDALSEL